MLLNYVIGFINGTSQHIVPSIPLNARPGPAVDIRSSKEPQLVRGLDMEEELTH